MEGRRGAEGLVRVRVLEKGTERVYKAAMARAWTGMVAGTLLSSDGYIRARAGPGEGLSECTRTLDRGFPVWNTDWSGAGVTAVIYRATFPAGSLEGGVGEALLLDGGGPSAGCLARALFSPAEHAAPGDTLQILWEITVYGGMLWEAMAYGRKRREF